MITYLCLLRSVNVAGRTIKMAALQQLFVALGHVDVTTYIQSGNVIFRSARTAKVDLAGEIEERIAVDLDIDVSIILRTREELAKVLTGNPFIGRGADPAKLHVTFLVDPADTDRGGIDQARFLPDEFDIVGREVYLHCPDGYGRSKLNNAFWERRLKVIATTRNWNTVNKLSRLASD